MNDMLEQPDDDVINANDLVDDPHGSLPRREILKALTALGVGTLTFRRTWRRRPPRGSRSRRT